MTVLCRRNDWNAVGNLGYALHNVPRFIRHPGSFDPDMFQFCFRIAAFNWDHHSLDLRRALCATIGIGLDRAERLIRSKGFAINNTAPRPIPFSKLKVAEEWVDEDKERRSRPFALGRVLGSIVRSTFLKAARLTGEAGSNGPT